jgi:hypothetical protein
MKFVRPQQPSEAIQDLTNFVRSLPSEAVQVLAKFVKSQCSEVV